MNLLDLFVRVGVKDETAGGLGSVESGVMGRLGSIAGAGAKLIGGAVAAVGTGTVALGKMATDSYATYEQLEGGINKLFGTGGKSLEEYAQSVGMSVEEAAGKYDSLSEAHKIVMQNAQQAYSTAGMSANDYMQQVTGFAAALTGSLGGDTVEAAKRADVAMRAISDNVNTFGTDVESVQYAFQGFAKQNYTMLDNLKLGYGGTKTEMERLISDANEYAASIGQASDLSIDSFADVVTAIDLIQQKQGIAGTTAREAATTIEGSVNMAKAAWSNWVTELGKDNADMQARTQELVESVATAAGNIVPRVSQIFTTLIQSIPMALAQIGTTLLPALQEMGASLLTTVGTLIQTLIEYLKSVDWATAVQEILTGIMTILQEAAPSLLELIPVILGVVGQIFVGIMTFIGEHAPEILAGVGDVIIQLTQMLTDNMPAILDAAGKMFMGLVQALPEILPKIAMALVELIIQVAGYIVTHIPEILQAGLMLFAALVKAVGDTWTKLDERLAKLIEDADQAIINAVGGMLDAAGQWFMGLIDGARQKFDEFLSWAGGIGQSALDAIGDLGRLLWDKGSELLNGLREGAENAADAVFNFVRDIPGNILNALGDLGSLLWDAGNSIFNGLFEGMESAWNGMTGWIGGIADQIANLKGPLPYDRKVLIENGQALMQGLRGGLKGAFEGDVIPYVSDMADKMADAFGETDLSASYDVASARATTAPQAMTPQAPTVNVIIKDTVIEKEADVDKVLERAESIIRRRTGGTVSWSTSPSMA